MFTLLPCVSCGCCTQTSILGIAWFFNEQVSVALVPYWIFTVAEEGGGADDAKTEEPATAAESGGGADDDKKEEPEQSGCIFHV